MSVRADRSETRVTLANRPSANNEACRIFKGEFCSRFRGSHGGKPVGRSPVRTDNRRSPSAKSYGTPAGNRGWHLKPVPIARLVLTTQLAPSLLYL